MAKKWYKLASLCRKQTADVHNGDSEIPVSAVVSEVQSVVTAIKNLEQRVLNSEIESMSLSDVQILLSEFANLVSAVKDSYVKNNTPKKIQVVRNLAEVQQVLQSKDLFLKNLQRFRGLEKKLRGADR